MEDLLCAEKNIIHLDGRDIGKSVCISTDALHFAFTTRGGQGLIAAPHQGHLDTIVEEIEFHLDAVQGVSLAFLAQPDMVQGTGSGAAGVLRRSGQRRLATRGSR